MSKPEPGHETPGKASEQAEWNLRWNSLAFLDSPEAVISPEEKAEWRDARIPSVFVFLNGSVTKKSITVGQLGSSSGAAGGAKMRASSDR